MKPKAISIFFVFVWVFIVIGGRLAHIALGGTFQTAGNQSLYTLTIDTPRGTVFDRNGLPITNRQAVYKSAVTATPQVISRIHQLFTGKEKEDVLQQLADRRPFILQTQQLLEVKGALDFACFSLYPANQPAVHLTGYVNADGQGVCGIQKSYDFLLCNTQPTTATFVCDATGGALTGIDPVIEQNQEDGQGVVTTLDLNLQTIVEQIFSQGKKGAVVVQKVHSGDILAFYSAPTFSPACVEQAVNHPDKPLLNRGLTPYNVGSVFKLCVAAAALEQGVSPKQTYTCTGNITHSHTFFCHKKEGHGTLTMEQALAQSCNTYFIDLAAQIGGQAVYDMASALGFGRSALLCQDVVGQAGQLPDLTELLRSPAELANFAIGQGVFLATPLQISAMTGAVASGGVVYEPRLILSAVTKSGTYQSGRVTAATPVFSADTAKALTHMMWLVMTEGTGVQGAPQSTSAAGKTATAQTGMVKEDGTPVTQAWFTGFFPTEAPRYVVTVLVEEGTSGGSDAAPIFKEICEGILAKEK